MTVTPVSHPGGAVVARVCSPSPVITDAQSALDLMATARYEMGSALLAVDKSALCEEFFTLSSGLAGDILQKFSNYRVKLAIIGDFDRYTSKPLRDFIYECNHGSDIFFVSTEQEAVDRLAAARR